MIIKQGLCDTRIDRNGLILVILPLRHSLLVISRIKAVNLRLQKRKTKNLQDLNISANSADSPCTTNTQNWRKDEKTWYYY